MYTCVYTNIAKIKTDPSVISRPCDICKLFFLAVTPRVLSRSPFSAAGQLGSLLVVCWPWVLLLKKAAKPLEWVVEVKERQQQVSDFSVSLNHCQNSYLSLVFCVLRYIAAITAPSLLFCYAINCAHMDILLVAPYHYASAWGWYRVIGQVMSGA